MSNPLVIAAAKGLVGDARTNCRACGDIVIVEGRADRVGMRGGVLHVKEFCYCEECANELFRGWISGTPAKTYPSGYGCPMEHEGSDDPSPWQENNVRIMDGD